MEKKVCCDCGIEKALDKFATTFSGKPSPLARPGYDNQAGVRKNRCRACYAARERAKLRFDFLDALGAICACCGEDDVRFLTLDHVDNSGAKHRKLFKDHQIYREARRKGYPRDKYQVLCFNCNSGRSCNGGICPHKDELTKEQAWERFKKRTELSGRIHVKYNNSESIVKARAAYQAKMIELRMSRQ
jgi:hypothetical protein